MSEVRRQQAKRAPKRFDAQALLQANPSGTERAMTVDNTFRLACGPRREQNERRLVERDQAGRQRKRRNRETPGQWRWRLECLDPHHTQRCRHCAICCATPDGEAGGGRTRQLLNLERSQTRIDRNCAAANAPYGKQIDEELQRVAVMEEDAVAGCEAMMLEKGDAMAEFALDRRRIPSSAGDGLDETADT